MGLKIDAKDFLTNMSAIKQRSMFAAEKVGQNAAACMEGEAKRNAGWTDRTGLARQTIIGYSGWQGKKLRMGVSGNMEYSVYLELAHEGRFAILWATVQANEQKIMDDSLYLVPWLRSKLTNERLSKVKSWVQIAVYAAEKIYGAEKWRPEAGICGGDSPQAQNQARHGDT